MWKCLILLTFFFSSLVSANCSKYYFSLDFGGRIGDGLKITDYLVKQKVPHVIFMVGNNLKTSEAKRLCSKINNDPEYQKYVKVGNHTQSHRGFKDTDKKSYIKSEIIDNENKIKTLCTQKNFVKVFRYPKGQSHPYAEKILKDNNYSSLYSKHSDPEFRTETGVGWTADTRDWIKEGSASIWAQETYAKKHKRFMPVTKESAAELRRHIEKTPKNSELHRLLDKKQPETFDKSIHKEIIGWHGPTRKFIEEKILNDRGVDGACVPLTHFGGYNTLAALKNVIPKLKERDKEFAMLDDHIEVSNVVKILENPKKLILSIDSKCVDPITQRNYIIVTNEDTLWGISKKTGISIGKLRQYNNLLGSEINLDQKLYLEPLVLSHVVSAGETLYGISKMYDISMSKLKQYNNLKSNEIDLNQKLIIKK
jgi:LysM repeat protein/peptidoglycan/xylan/chitin deacetylase (PgdA/CDA1 family)